MEATRQVNYMRETMEMLEKSTEDGAVCNDEDYLMLGLRILKCDAFLSQTDSASKLKHITIDKDKYQELTQLFYAKMLNDIGDEDE